MENPFHYHNDDHCEILLFDTYLLKQVKEGSTIVPEHAHQLKILIDEHYGDKPFVYISNRTHSYSVDPLTYKAAEIMTNLMGIAIVAEDDKVQQAAFERIFFKKPFAIFKDLKKAVEWVGTIIDKDGQPLTSDQDSVDQKQ